MADRKVNNGESSQIASPGHSDPARNDASTHRTASMVRAGPTRAAGTAGPQAQSTVYMSGLIEG